MFNAIIDSRGGGQILNSAISTLAEEISENNLGTGLTEALENSDILPDENGCYALTITEFLHVISKANTPNTLDGFTQLAANYEFLSKFGNEINSMGINTDDIYIYFLNGEFSNATYLINPFDALCKYVLEKDSHQSQLQFLMHYLDGNEFRNKVQITKTETINENEERFTSLLYSTAFALQKRFSHIKQDFVGFLNLKETSTFKYLATEGIEDPLFTKLQSLTKNIHENKPLREIIMRNNRKDRPINGIKGLVEHIEGNYMKGDRDMVLTKILEHYHPDLKLVPIKGTTLKTDKFGNISRDNG